MSLSLSSKHVIMTLMLIIAVLTGVSLLMNLVFLHVNQSTAAYYATALFSVEEESNIPSLYSALALFAAAGVLLCVYFCYRRHDRKSRGFVIFLSAVFVYLSLDEAIAVHERLTPVTGHLIPQAEVLYTMWVVPGIVFVSLIFLASIQFLRRLDPPTRTLVVTSGAMFVGGAIGLEIAAWMYLRDNDPDTVYVLYSAGEEFLEMSGVGLFIFALLRHLETDFGGIRITIGMPADARPGGTLSARM